MSGGSVDFEYLETYTGGDRQVITEVLALFLGQADGWTVRLGDPGEGWRDLNHTIKGAARGIGAVALGEAAHRAEAGDPSRAPEVLAALGEVQAAIREYVKVIS
ncbi:MAG: Hpt domain-containing protein [Alphaproteobacteria bacterium]|jgi:HPt (histidine-containing phosphotransfer) domain-containing protein